MNYSLAQRVLKWRFQDADAPPKTGHPLSYAELHNPANLFCPFPGPAINVG